jgi:hypothetical protein
LYNQQLATRIGLAPRPSYHAQQFDQMIIETKPDVVIVTTMDCARHLHHARNGTRL